MFHFHPKYFLQTLLLGDASAFTNGDYVVSPPASLRSAAALVTATHMSASSRSNHATNSKRINPLSEKHVPTTASSSIGGRGLESAAAQENGSSEASPKGKKSNGDGIEHGGINGEMLPTGDAAAPSSKQHSDMVIGEKKGANNECGDGEMIGSRGAERAGNALGRGNRVGIFRIHS